MDSYADMNGQGDGGTHHVYDALAQQFYPVPSESLAPRPAEHSSVSWYESLDSAYGSGSNMFPTQSVDPMQSDTASAHDASFVAPRFLGPSIESYNTVDPYVQEPVKPLALVVEERAPSRPMRQTPDSLAPAIQPRPPASDDNDFTKATGMAHALTTTLTKPTPMGPPVAPSLLSRRADAFNKKAAARRSIDSSPPSSPASPRANLPVYGYYGSSVIDYQSPAENRPMPNPSTFVPLPDRPPTPEAFDPAALGLPQPSRAAPGQSQNRKGLYSTSGFDMLAVLARVLARPNPEIELGPVDAGCSFVVVDARKYDQPIVYASENFSRLTGYSNAEILGQNCRFLQSPDAVVVGGSKRKYTDGQACYHLKKHIMTGRETQASLINYCKGGRPFINLVTIIPIAWDSSDIAYYVGFQVDLVDQPTAILEKMKNGTYIVNYSVLGQAMPRTVSADRTFSIEAPSSYDMEQSHSQGLIESHANNGDANTSVDLPSHVDPSQVTTNPSKLIDSIATGSPLSTSFVKTWQRLIIDHCDDFMHVLSIKGTFLYVSPSAARLLEYEPEELMGKTLASICHPSDVVAVLRELKEAGSVNRPKVSLLYRVQRKRSGYQWMECQGKMHVEAGKGRKSVILVGRPRDVYKMSWADLELAGGLADREFWSKMTTDGQLLYTTPNVKKIIGLTSSELLGSRFSRLLPEEDVGKHEEILTAIDQSSRGQLSNVRHRIKGRSGNIDVSTNFYPSESTDEAPRTDSVTSPPRQYTAIVQTSVFTDSMASRPKVPLPTQAARPKASQASHSSVSMSSTSSNNGSPAPSPIFSSASSSSLFSSSSSLQSIPRKLGDSDHSDSAGSSSGSGSSFSAIPSTFKTLPDATHRQDNVFDELVTTRGTSWQFELHQLKLTNRRLREEKEALTALQQRKRRHVSMLEQAPSPGAPRACANCGRTGSPEWRMGPTGPKTLCNACGLRWSKARSTTSTPSEAATTPRPPLSTGAPSPLGHGAVASPRVQRPPFFSIPSELTSSFEASHLGS